VPDHIDPATVPGYPEAVAALVQWLGDPNDHGMQPHHVGEMVAIVMAVTRPHVQAEMLADMSDNLAERGHGALAGLLDNVSGEIRKALHSG